MSNKRIVILEKSESQINTDLIEQHENGTKFCSFMVHMRTASPTYTQIMRKGHSIIPDILRYMQNNPEHSGMSIMLLLWDILNLLPYEPEKVTNNKGQVVPGMAFTVKDAVKSWIDWGIKEGHITEKEKTK